MKNKIIRTTRITGDNAYPNGFVVQTEGLYTFRLEFIAAGEKMNPSGNLLLAKRPLVGWMSRS